jgi:septum formation protein
VEPVPLILASGSPRRREILADFMLDFSVKTASVDETVIDGETPEESVVRLALAKADAVAEKNNDSLVIAADSIVTIDGRIIGKPADKEDAREILRLLGGRTHNVVTGVAFVRLCENLRRSSACRSRVTFHDLTGEMIDQYLDTGEYADKAGGYAIQGYGKVLVKSYGGSFTNIVGLPVRELLRFVMWYGPERMPWRDG